MAKYMLAWQRVVIAALEAVPGAESGADAWAKLPEGEKQAIRVFAAERCSGDSEKAGMMIGQLLPSVRLSGGGGKLPLLLAAALAAIGAGAAASRRLGFALGAVLAFAVLIYLLNGARHARVRKLWADRTDTALCLKAMHEVELGSVFAAVNKLWALLALLAALACGVLAVLPEPPPTEAELLAAKVGEVTKGEAVLADALAILPEGEDGLDVARQAMKYTVQGSDEEFLLAALTWMHIEDNAQLGLSDYAVGTASDAAREALESTKLSQIDNPEEMSALALLLGRVDGPSQEAFFRRALRENALSGELMTVLGTGLRSGRDDATLLLLADEIRGAGYDPRGFVQAALPTLTVARVTEIVAAAEAEQRGAILRGAAPAITEVDEVMAFIRLAKEHGVSAEECYPQGALLTWDTTRYNPVTSNLSPKLGKRDTYLIIRRWEKPEPFTSIAVPETDRTAYDASLPVMLHHDYDPDAELGAAQFTVVLETAVLDAMPEERIPESIAACDALVILDGWYQCDGYVRSSRHTSMQQASKTHQVDIPTYGALQMISVYNVASGEGLFSVKQKVSYSPAMTGGEARRSMDEWALEDNYIAAYDESWMDEAYKDFLFSLIRRNWVLVP